MSLPSNNRRQSSVATSFEKNRNAIKTDETKSGTFDKSVIYEHTDSTKKFEMPIFMGPHRKSDADKTSYTDSLDKEPYVRESKEFAGVTIIFRTAPNPRAFGSFDGQAKTANRRKSEFQHAPSNIQDKSEHRDKTDHTGTN